MPKEDALAVEAPSPSPVVKETTPPKGQKFSKPSKALNETKKIEPVKDSHSDTDAGEFKMPPDEMKIERLDSSVLPKLPEAEKLLEDACTNIREGNHQKGKEKIEQYLRLHPNDKYWEHVNGILD